MFNCAGCIAKDKEIAHLRAIVDSIMIAKGLGPVSQDNAKTGLEPQEVEQVAERIEDSGISTHGGHE